MESCLLLRTGGLGSDWKREGTGWELVRKTLVSGWGGTALGKTRCGLGLLGGKPPWGGWAELVKVLNMFLRGGLGSGWRGGGGGGG